MNRTHHMLAAGAMLLATTVPLRTKADASLYLDGRLHAQGSTLDNARVVVARNTVPMQVLINDLRHIQLRLDLQTTYVLSFELEGYRTKEIFFDTRMGEEALAGAPYTFLFDVTLEPVSRVGEARYLGPVGYVRYEAMGSDFDYDLDYRLTHDAQGNVLASSDDADASSQASRGAAGSGLSVSTGPRGERRYAQPFIEPTKEMEAKAPIPSVSAVRARRERHFVQPFIDPTMEMERMAAYKMQVADQASSAGDGEVCAVAGKVEGVTSLGMTSPALFDPHTMDRSVIVEEERVITIVRVAEDDHFTEFRRVAHANGTVLTYKNSSSCSFQEYASAVGTE